MTPLTPQDRQTLRVLYSMMATDNRRKHPDNPYPLAPKPYDVRKTSQLEGAICKLLHLYGYNSARRTHVVGRQLEPDRVTYNIITGRRQTLDKGRYIPTTGRKGEADIHANIILKDGTPRSLAIEVKNQYSNDRMRPEQVKYKEDFEADGGLYIVVRSITEAMEFVDQNLMKKINY